MKPYLLPAAIFILLVLHAVGIWGLLFSGQTESFQRLTPFNLIVSNILLFAFHRDWRPCFIIFVLVCAFFGFFAEVAGIHTGLIFGEYSYGESLGYKVLDVPLLIGLNWLMLVYATGSLFSLARVPLPLRVLGAALLMVALDMLIEPVAIQFDFWSWNGNDIPVSNFIGWFGVALVLQVLFQLMPFGKQNNLAPWLLIIQTLFFLLLNIGIIA